MPNTSGIGRWRARRLLAAVALLLAATLGYLIAAKPDSRAAASGAPDASSLYPALANSRPRELTLSGAAPTAGETQQRQPVWYTAGGGEDRPLAGTIRLLPATDPELSSWIAQSPAGGVCVLLAPARGVGGTRPIGATCTPGTDQLQVGTYITYEYPEGGTYAIAGVAPAGVDAVQLTFPDGSTRTVPVSEDGWALESTHMPLAVREQPDGLTISTGGV